MDRLERLINLTAALLDTGRPLDRHQIQDRVPGYSRDPDTFRRAFERDKELLRSMGIPIEIQESLSHVGESYDGYLIAKEKYELPEIELDQDELRAINVAMAAVQLDSSRQTSALRKLGGTFDIAPSIDLASVETSPVLVQIFSAINEKRSVAFLYKGDQRTIDPLRLLHERGHWYVRGFDHERQDERSFRVDRIDEINNVSEPESFDRIASVETKLPPWMMGDGDPIIAQLNVDEANAESVAVQLGESATSTTNEDKSVTFQVPVTSPEAFRGFVLSLLDHAVVLGPAELRNDVVCWLEEFAS